MVHADIKIIAGMMESGHWVLFVTLVVQYHGLVDCEEFYVWSCVRAFMLVALCFTGLLQSWTMTQLLLPASYFRFYITVNRFSTVLDVF